MPIATKKKRQPSEAELVDDIAAAYELVAHNARRMKRMKGRLCRIAADAFNEESEPLTGMVVDAENIVFGSDLGRPSCEASPIGVCAYDRLSEVEPLPGQRAARTVPITGCLFCGTDSGVQWPYLRGKL